MPNTIRLQLAGLGLALSAAVSIAMVVVGLLGDSTALIDEGHRLPQSFQMK
jgi:hypothetical protein